MIKKEPFIFLIFSLLFFIPRYFSHLQYQALEDELLAIWNNYMYNFSELLRVPDFTHPPLWYLLMDIPTKIIGVRGDVFYYRLIQVISLFGILSASIFYFKNKLNNLFIKIFLILFLTNNYLIHITSQHRMYAIVLGLGVFYSFLWFYVLQDNLTYKKSRFILLGIFAALAMLINFSALWVIAFWPLVFLFFSRQKIRDKLSQLCFFGLSFILCTVWFYPIFWHNAQTSISVNQWAGSLTMTNVLQVVGVFFGLMPRLSQLNEYNFFVLPSLVVFFGVFFYSLTKSNETIYKRMVISYMGVLLFCFFGYLLLVWLTDNSLLYPRPIITLVIPLYVLISVLATMGKPGKFLFFVIVLIQLYQLFMYFAPISSNLIKGYDLYNYRKNSIAHFSTFNFEKDDCLFPTPHWNYFAAYFFFGERVRVIDGRFYREVLKEKPDLSVCNNVYVLEQYSVSNYNFQSLYQFLFVGSKLKLIETYQNQHFYMMMK